MKKYNFDFDYLKEKEQARIVKASVIPRPIAWITTLNETGSVNVAPFSYFTAISSTLLAVSFQKSNNIKKDTLLNILRTKEAVIHIVDKSILNEMDESSRNFKRNESEVDNLKLKLEDSLKIKTPSLENTLLRLEVKLNSVVPLMDYNNKKEEADLLILRVVAATVKEEIYDFENNYILADKLKPVARLAGADYGEVKILDFKRNY